MALNVLSCSWCCAAPSPLLHCSISLLEKFAGCSYHGIQFWVTAVCAAGVKALPSTAKYLQMTCTRCVCRQHKPAVRLFALVNTLWWLQLNRPDSSEPAAPASAKKMTVWKKLKKALFTPGKSKREAAAQQLMQAHADTPNSQRYSEKHANQADGMVGYSRRTSFQEPRDSVSPSGPYRSACLIYASLH